MRFLLAGISAIVLLAATACGGGGSSNTESPTGEQPQLTDPASVPTSTPIDAAKVYRIGNGSISAPDGNSINITTGTGTPTTTAERNVYTIESGDTCFGIAETLGVSSEELLEANPNLDCAGLVPGNELRIPASAEPEETPTPTPGDADRDGDEADDEDDEDDAEPTDEADDDAGGGESYTIQEGDTCVDIAANFDVDVDELVAQNGIDCGNLQLGASITIP